MDTSGLCCPAFFSPGQLIGAQGDSGRLEAELWNLHILSHPAGSKLTTHLHQSPLHSTALPGCGLSFTPSGLLSTPTSPRMSSFFPVLLCLVFLVSPPNSTVFKSLECDACFFVFILSCFPRSCMPVLKFIWEKWVTWTFGVESTRLNLVAAPANWDHSCRGWEGKVNLSEQNWLRISHADTLLQTLLAE